jgi:hypothetical protein
MPAKTIHLVFKTHLDIGFTDHAAKVRQQYHDRFIPQALETGEHFFAEDPKVQKFIWTTGAWLIFDHLATQSKEKVARLERAIERGLIRWHALPFTTHSELMSTALFSAGLSYSAELDQRFGKTTIAAKMTDVPGHTIGIVPLLAKAGVKFLHLGVNAASPPPDVADLFRWRAPGGEEVVVMYQKEYGATYLPEGFDDGLSFAHTGDNLGPQSVPQVAEIYRDMHRHFPGAAIKAATLDDFGALLWGRREEFPIIDLELGDSWIHGSASDPIKTQQFLSMQRYYDGFVEGRRLTSRHIAFGRALTMVAEHTCGVDIKSYLRDETAWDRPAFEAARSSDYRFRYTEASWAEQRALVTAALTKLTPTDREVGEAILKPVTTVGRHFDVVPATSPITVDGWTIGFDASTGDVTSVAAPDGKTIAGADGSLMGYRYESYDATDIKRHLDTYITSPEEWAYYDHAKPGIENAKTAQSKAFTPSLLGVSGHSLVLELDPVAHETLGAPRRVTIGFHATRSGRSRKADRLIVTVSMTEKPANRMPEASFVTFTPSGVDRWDFYKMGLWQRGDRIAANGGGQLQAVFDVRGTIATGGTVEIDPIDTPLVAPAGSPFMPFNKQPPDLSQGIRFNIHNNKWGTNFPMWWEGDLVARYILTLT